jgi:hypothetical protein
MNNKVLSLAVAVKLSHEAESEKLIHEVCRNTSPNLR